MASLCHHAYLLHQNLYKKRDGRESTNTTYVINPYETNINVISFFVLQHSLSTIHSILIDITK